ncbi:MAG: hypothetical protein WCB31_10935, partial [Nitrososphaeraceae archaeon]
MIRISLDRILLVFLTISMITAYPAQMYIGSDLKLLSSSFLETSNAQFDNGSTIQDNDGENDEESKVESGESTIGQEVTTEQEQVQEPTAAEEPTEPTAAEEPTEPTAAEEPTEPTAAEEPT